MGLSRLPLSPPPPRGVVAPPGRGETSLRPLAGGGETRAGRGRGSPLLPRPPRTAPAPSPSWGTAAPSTPGCWVAIAVQGHCKAPMLLTPWPRGEGMQRGGGRQSLGRAPPAPLVCLGVGRRVSCPPAGRDSADDAPPPSTQVPSGPSPERWSRLCTGKALPCPAPSERHSLPFRPALTSRPQVQRALLALTIPLEALQAVKDRMLQAMRKGLSRQTHAQANVRMLPTYICSTPDGTGKAAQPGDVLLCYLQPCLPCWMWPRGCWGRVHWSPVSYWVHKLPLCCLCQSSGQGQRPGADSLGLCSSLRLSGASPVGE